MERQGSGIIYPSKFRNTENIVKKIWERRKKKLIFFSLNFLKYQNLLS